MLGVNDGLNAVITGLIRIYHIKQQKSSNDEAVAALEQKLNDLGGFLAKLRDIKTDGSISLASIDQVISETRDYIKRYKEPSITKQGMKWLRVDKISEAVNEHETALNKEIELVLFQMNVNVHHQIANSLKEQSQMHATVKDIDRKINALQEDRDNNVYDKAFFLENTEVVDARTALIHERLRQWYLREEASLIRLDVGEEMRTIRVDELFINLEIIEELKQPKDSVEARVKQQFAQEEKAKPTSSHATGNTQLNIHDPFSEQSLYETIYHQKKEIKLDNLFVANPQVSGLSKIPNKVLMLGRAGVGKTTLCLYQTYRWAKGDLWKNEIHWMFHFELKKVANCRALENENKIHKILYEMILRHFEDLFTEEQSEAFWSMLLRRSDPIVFLIDGYDEVSDRQHPACEALMAVVNNHPTASHLRMLVTSRPYARIEGKMDITLENIGFKDENIPNYIENYFSYFQSDDSHHSVTLSQNLIQWLNQRSKIKQICRTPIHLELLCSVWQLYSKQLIEEDLVISDLYAFMVEKLVRRYLRKTLAAERVEALAALNLNEVMALPESQEILRFLKELAYQGLKAGNIIIRKELFRSIVNLQGKGFQQRGALQRLLSTGFLKAVGDSSDDPLAMDYHFIHLSFQEYLTAYYFSEHIADDQHNKEINQFIAEYKYDPTYQLVWIYVGGLLRNNEKAFKHYFGLLTQSPRDLFGMYELALLVRCSEEAKWPSYSILHALLEYLGKWTMNISQLKVEEHQHAVYFLNHLTALYLACPNAMLRVRYQGSEGLFNIMMHEARDQHRLEEMKGVLDRLFNYADIGYYLAQIFKDQVNEKAASKNAKLGLKIGLSFFYGLIKFISLILYSIIFIIGNVPLLMFLNQYKNYKLKQANAVEFMTKFEFDDIQAVLRLIAQLKHPDVNVRLRLVRAIANVKFSPEVIPKVYLSLFQLFTHDTRYEVRQAAYQQLLKLFPGRMTHNEPLWFFNFSLQNECLKNDLFYQNSSLVEKLFSYYPDKLVKLGIDFVTQMREHYLADYPQINSKKEEMAKHFCLECLKLLRKEINTPSVTTFVKDTLFSLVVWQYSDIHDEATHNDYFLTIADVVAALTDATNISWFVWTMAQEMQDKRLSRRHFMDKFYPLLQYIIEKNSQIKTIIEESAVKAPFMHLPANNDIKNFIEKNDTQLEEGTVLEEIKAFDRPYVENALTTKSSHFITNNDNDKTENKASEHPLQIEKTLDINMIIKTLSKSVNPEKILSALNSLNLAEITDKNRDDLMAALLTCANKLKHRRYAFYYLPRIALSHLIAYTAIFFAYIWASCWVDLLSFTSSTTCAVNFFTEWENGTLPEWALIDVSFLSAIVYASIVGLNIFIYTTNNFLSKNYVGDWEDTTNNESIFKKFSHGTALFDALNLITFNLLGVSLYLFTCGFSSQKRMQQYTTILVQIAKLIHEENLFVSLLKSYPNYFNTQSQSIFYCVLRDKLASSTTAITHESFNHFTWYKGRTKITFASMHPLRLILDIKSVRLLSHYFGWLATLCQPSCWRQEQTELTSQAFDQVDGLESRASFWQYFNKQKTTSTDSRQAMEMIGNPMIGNPLNSNISIK